MASFGASHLLRHALHASRLFVAIRAKDGTDGEGDVDVFCAVALGQGFDKFVLELGAIREAPGVEDDVEIDGGIAEGVEVHGGRLDSGAFEAFHDGRSDGEGDGFHFF